MYRFKYKPTFGLRKYLRKQILRKESRHVQKHFKEQ